MKKLLFCMLLLANAAFCHAAQSFTVEIEGPESSYNQIRVVNETSQTDFRCRVLRLSSDGSSQNVYYIYDLKEKNDRDSHTETIKRGEKITIELPKDFPSQVSCYLEYKDFPLFDAIIIHLIDADEFEEL